MKTTLLKISAILFLITSCDNIEKKKLEKPQLKLAPNEYRINGSTLADDGTDIYLYEIENDSLIAKDTSIVSSNKFSFQGQLNSPTFFALKSSKMVDSPFIFIADNSEINLTLNSPQEHSIITSLSDNQLSVKKYNDSLKKYNRKEIELFSKFKKNVTNKTAATLKTDIERVIKDRKGFIFNFISKNNSSEIAPLLLQKNLKTLSYPSLITLQDTLSESLQEMAIVKNLKLAITSMEEENVKEKEIKLENNRVREYRTKARPIQGATPSGSMMSLNSIPKGKVILVDFWASWCGPCRMTNPKLVYLHNRYKDKGLVILNVSEDKDTGKWISAIAQDNLTWNTHILDKNGLIASSYGVDAIPHKVLLDKQGRIAEWKISGSNLERRIQELLNE